MSEHLERETDELETELARARRTDKRQKWWLFALAMIALVLAAILGVIAVNAWAEAEAERMATANEQVEKKEMAEETRQAFCQSGDTAIYDHDLCNRLAAVAGEPVRGDSGPQGPQGPRGPEGPQGEQGPRGFLGVPGLAGPAGSTGGQGPQGTPGLAGADGAPGLPGAAGMDGAPGANGLDGAPGPVGAQGETGPQGPPGADGSPGPQGPPGNDGAPGPAGPPGADSTVPGPAGPPGANGAQGVSIVDVDCVGEGRDSTWQITLSNGEVLNGGGPCKTNGPPIEVTAP